MNALTTPKQCPQCHLLGKIVGMNGAGTLNTLVTMADFKPGLPRLGTFALNSSDVNIVHNELTLTCPNKHRWKYDPRTKRTRNI